MAGKVKQNALTVVTRIKPEGLAPLQSHLEAIGAGRTQDPLARMATVHFARWVIFPNADDEGKSLLFDNNYDGDFDTFIQDFVTICGAELDEIWGYCEGYPMSAGATRNIPNFKKYIQDNSLPYLVFYDLYGTQSVAQIKKDVQLRERLQKVLDMDVLQNLIPYL